MPVHHMWSELIYRENDQHYPGTIFPEGSLGKLSFSIAASLYEDIAGSLKLPGESSNILPEFSDLSPKDKAPWISYADGIPSKLVALNLFIRPYSEFCHTCIITHSEVEILKRIDNRIYSNKNKSGNKDLSMTEYNGRIHPLRKLMGDAGIKIRDPERELNLLIPLQLKKQGFEIIRTEEAMEIDPAIVIKLARVIHNKYLRETKNRKKTNDMTGFFTGYLPGEGTYPANFDDLPLEIKYSNLDNAYHIPTKLLSIGYKIRPLNKGYRSFTLDLNEEEIETMARVEHIRWCWEKRLNGWRYGEKRDNNKKIHPGLIEYDELDESEKDKDRDLVKLIPALLKDIGFEAYPVAPGRVKNLSYAIKPQSTIHKLLTETNNLAREIASLTGSSTEITGRLHSIRNKIEASIKEVQGSYNYASHIQEVFLPENIFIRECFPDSFVLFKPKNLVSGDFYFFSRREHFIFFALADCTGHGIPAALISTIGYGNLDQVINVVGTTEPLMILDQLYSSIHRFLRRDIPGYGLEDDMDITLCRYNTNDNTLTISGMGNHVFCHSNSKLEDIRLEHFSGDQGNGSGYMFCSLARKIMPGDTLYICSDGYADQFGGSNNKRYMKKRLMKFLSGIVENPLPVQNDMLYSELERWRSSADAEQTDDISVIGIRF